MDAYKMLNLRDQKRRGNVITDEMVQRNYLAIRDSYLRMSERHNIVDYQNENSRIELGKTRENFSRTNSEEINAMMRGDYLELLQKAYETISTEDARANYEEEWQEIQKQEEQERNNRNETISTEQQFQEVNPIEPEQFQTENQIRNKRSSQIVQPITPEQSFIIEQPVQTTQTEQQIKFTPIMSDSSIRKTRMRKMNKKISSMQRNQKYTGIITLTKQTPEERQKLAKDEIKFTPIMSSSTHPNIQEQSASYEQQEQNAKVPFLKKVLGMINKEKVDTNKLIKEVGSNSKNNNKEQKETTEISDENEDMEL